MSNHHGRHRSSRHSRSRMHHSSFHYQSSSNRSRNQTSSSNNHSNANNNGGGSNRVPQERVSQSRESASDWTEHRSSSGKVYYYNPRTGVSQWEVPAEMRQRVQSPESDLSESSSIRQQQDKSPSPIAPSESTSQSDSASDDKPLLTPSLAQYYRPDLIENFNSSQVQELELQANVYAKEALTLNQRILEESVDLKIANAIMHYVDITLEAQQKKFNCLKDTIKNFGFV